MNKLATNPKEPLSVGLLAFIEEKPTGYSESSESSGEAERFLGWGWHTLWTRSIEGDHGCCEIWGYKQYTIFGIPSGKPEWRFVERICL